MYQVGYRTVNTIILRVQVITSQRAVIARSQFVRQFTTNLRPFYAARCLSPASAFASTPFIHLLASVLNGDEFLLRDDLFLLSLMLVRMPVATETPAGRPNLLLSRRLTIDGQNLTSVLRT